MSHPRHSEAAFETVIEVQLLANGYLSVDRDSFDREPAILPEAVTEPTIILPKEHRAVLIAAAVTGRMTMHESMEENLPGADRCQDN